MDIVIPKRVLVVLIVLVLLPMLMLIILNSDMNSQRYKKGAVLVEDYHILIYPAFFGRFPDGPVDSCVLIINETNNPIHVDTLVYYHRVGSSLKILIEDNHKWTLIDKFDDSHCSSHFLDIHYDRDGIMKIEESSKAFLCLELLEGEACFRLSYANLRSAPPYSLKTVYTSRRLKIDTTKRLVASAHVRDIMVDWIYSDVYNYAIISDKTGVVTDTLRWYRTVPPYNSWSCMMVGDTILIDDYKTERPSCLSPLIVRRKSDMIIQYPKRIKDYSETIQSLSSNSVIYIEFIDKLSWSKKETIKVLSLDLPSSPLDGQIINNQLFEEHPFIRKE